jgi:hypothetical protein
LHQGGFIISSQNISSFENPHIKIDLLLLPRGRNPLSYYILYNESKHNILALVGKADKYIKMGQTYYYSENRHRNVSSNKLEDKQRTA